MSSPVQSSYILSANIVIKATKRLAIKMVQLVWLQNTLTGLCVKKKKNGQVFV